MAEEAQIPAQEPGVLKKLPVREGQSVAVGDLLAQIDDEQPRVAADVAQAKLDVASKQATDDINVRYARAAADVAKVELRPGRGRKPAYCGHRSGDGDSGAVAKMVGR